MLDKILQSRLEQVVEFKKDAIDRKELLEVRIEELAQEESLLSQLVDLYRIYNPDPTAIKDKLSEDILKGSPKKTRVAISSELANALTALEQHKRMRIEHKVRLELEKMLRKELEPRIREELYEEIKSVITQEKEIISDIKSIVQDEKAFAVPKAGELKTEAPPEADIGGSPALKGVNPKPRKNTKLSQVIDKQKEENKKNARSKKPVGPLINSKGVVSHKLFEQEIRDYILKNNNNFVTIEDLAKHFEETHPYLLSVWATVKKGVSNVINNMDGLETQRLTNKKTNSYRIAK